VRNLRQRARATESGAGFIKIRMRRAGLVLAVLAAFTLLLSSYRLVPMVEALPAMIRVMAGLPAHDFAALRLRLIALPTDLYGAEGQYYLGAALLAFPLGLFARRGRIWWVIALACAACAAGHFASWSPFTLLRKLPLYETLRYPERYLLFLAPAGAVLAALGLTGAAARLRIARMRGKLRFALDERVLAVLAIAFCMYSSVYLAQVAAAWSQTMLRAETPAAARHIGEFKQTRGSRWIASYASSIGQGTLSCGEAYPVPMSPRLRANLEQEEYLEDAAAGTVRRIVWTPNHIQLQVEASKPTRVLVNQNYHPGWKSNAGMPESAAGLLALAVPAGRSTVDLQFAPRSARVGLLATLAGCVLLALCWRYRTRLQHAHIAGAGVSTLAASGLLYLAYHDGPLTRVAPTTDRGEPVLLDALPAGVIKTEIAYQGGLQLRGYRIAAPMPLQDEPGYIVRRVELYWERTGKVSTAVAPFVHLRGGASANADHPEFSSLVYPSRAPLGRVVLDAFDIVANAASPSATAQTSKLYVGLWNAAGDGTRVQVESAANLQIEEHAVVLDAP
jgi:hypothetical protein